jgi:hypothetical protein
LAMMTESYMDKQRQPRRMTTDCCGSGRKGAAVNG